MDNLNTRKSEKKELSLLTINNIILAFERKKILAIEKISDIDTHQTLKGSSGTLHYSTSELPIYTFDEELTLLNKPTPNNRLCIALDNSNNDLFAITCDAIEHYKIENKNKINKVPSLNHHPDSPIIGLIKKDSKLVLLTSTESMRVYINSQEVTNA